MEKPLIGTIVIEKWQPPKVRVGQRIENGQLHEYNGEVSIVVETSSIEKVEWLGNDSFRIETANSVYFVTAE